MKIKKSATCLQTITRLLENFLIEESLKTQWNSERTIGFQKELALRNCTKDTVRNGSREFLIHKDAEYITQV